MDLYPQFIAFVQSELQKERSRINRRMLGVVVWCFVVPAIFGVLLLLFVRMGWMPPKVRSNLSGLMLLVPVLYAVSILGYDGFKEWRKLFRLGGTGAALKQPLEDHRKRQKTTQAIQQKFNWKPAEISQVRHQFQMDLESMQHQNRYMTLFAGAIFFLIFQGIDALDVLPEAPLAAGAWVQSAIAGIHQTLALLLFLVLFYLSGTQLQRTLVHYRNCLDLLLLEAPTKKPPKATKSL